MLRPHRKAGQDKARRLLPASGLGEPVSSVTIRRRLAEERATLERLDAERVQRRNPVFGKTDEDQIVWGELLELELQDIDEQVKRICNRAGKVSGWRGWISRSRPGSSSK